ncbi:MAG: hypothetical protein SGJ19_28010 [Planctomycetia bacterium]|nr:hypothetical protein [Planctomycetia bacterium]
MPIRPQFLSTNGSRRRNMLSNWLLVLLAPLFALIAILTMPVLLLFVVLDQLRLRHYCWKHQVWTFLVSTQRRGWHEFVRNNVEPVLPDGMALLWTSDVATLGSPMRWLISAVSGQVKPCIVHVRLFRVRVRSIHALLKDRKWQRRVDVEVQGELRQIMKEEVERIVGEAKQVLP